MELQPKTLIHTYNGMFLSPAKGWGIPCYVPSPRRHTAD